MTTPIDSVVPEIHRQIVGSTREGSAGKELGLMSHALVTDNPFKNIERLNYKAQDRELLLPSEKASLYRGAYAAGDVKV